MKLLSKRYQPPQVTTYGDGLDVLFSQQMFHGLLVRSKKRGPDSGPLSFAAEELLSDLFLQLERKSQDVVCDCPADKRKRPSRDGLLVVLLRQITNYLLQIKRRIQLPQAPYR